MTDTNRKVVLIKPVDGAPRPENFQIAEAPMPTVGQGEFLVRHIYLSLDPYQRPALAGRHITARQPLPIGQTPGGETVGQVVASRHPGFATGDYVRHLGGWQSYSVSDGQGAFRIDPAAAPLSTYLGVLGMPGLTAYASVIRLADVQAGQTVLVSAASGPVGSMVGQLAMQRGARAIGIASSDEKCRFVTDTLGFAACINHRAPGFPEQLGAVTGTGVDVYHDNVGGALLDAALGVLRIGGTVILCGLMSQYNAATREGFNLGLAIMKRAVLKGLVVFDHEEARESFFTLAAPWVRSGKIRYREDRVQGLEHAGQLFARLMEGQNFGKALVVLGPET
jgi:NADPH-dependent curcumin reductase